MTIVRFANGSAGAAMTARLARPETAFAAVEDDGGVLADFGPRGEGASGLVCGCAACMGKALGSPVQQSAAIPGNTTSTATIAIGGQVTGSLDSSGDQDWYRVDLVAGQHYVFELNATGGTPLGDPYLELRSSTGVLLSIDDDGAPGASSILDSLMRFTATQTGTYFINVRAYDTETGG